MRFVNPIPFVRDINRSREFYKNTMGLNILQDFGNFVLFETGFAIHDGCSLERTIWNKEFGSEASYGRKNLLLYFEHDDVEESWLGKTGHPR